jgi:hypothetical protein
MTLLRQAKGVPICLKKVFVSISIDSMTSYNPYKNKLLVITLKVEKDGAVENWLEMKKSYVEGGGFGVFALCIFFQKSLFLFIWVKRLITLTCTRTL